MRTTYTRDTKNKFIGRLERQALDDYVDELTRQRYIKEEIDADRDATVKKYMDYFIYFLVCCVAITIAIVKK